MSGNRLPAMLQMPWLALSLALIWTTVTMFYSMSRKNFDKLQRVQNRAAQIVCGIGQRQQSARQLCHSLHWLPVRARIDFKLATLSYKSRMTGQPDYLAAELRSYQPQLSLRPSSQELLTVSHCKTMLGRRRFSVAALRVWNSLPLGLKTVTYCAALKLV